MNYTISEHFDRECSESLPELEFPGTGSSSFCGCRVIPATLLSSATPSATTWYQERPRFNRTSSTYTPYEDILSLPLKLQQLGIRTTKVLELTDYLQSHEDVYGLLEKFIGCLLSEFVITEISINEDPHDKYIVIELQESESHENFDSRVLDLYSQFRNELSESTGWIQVKSSLER